VSLDLFYDKLFLERSHFALDFVWSCYIATHPRVLPNFFEIDSIVVVVSKHFQNKILEIFWQTLAFLEVMRWFLVFVFRRFKDRGRCLTCVLCCSAIATHLFHNVLSPGILFLFLDLLFPSILRHVMLFPVVPELIKLLVSYQLVERVLDWSFWCVRHSTCDHEKKYDTAGKNVYKLATVRSFLENFWSLIESGSYLRVMNAQTVATFFFGRKTKVCDL